VINPSIRTGCVRSYKLVCPVVTDRRATSHCRHDVPRITRFAAYLKGTGLTRASQIAQAHVEDYQNELLSTLSQRALRNCMYAASGLLSFAVGRGYLSANVIKNEKKDLP
jgi:hypothetical protein